MEENFLLDLVSGLDQRRSQKQVNADIKMLEKTINKLRLTATLAQGSSKKEINVYLKQLSSQLSTIKLKAQIDSKNIKSEVNKALNSVSFKDIDVLNIDGNKTKLKIQKVIADAKAYTEKNPVSIGINFENRRNKLDNDLTTYLNKNTKINESSVLLKEADKVRDLIDTITDKKSLTEATDAFRLFKSECAATGYTSKSTADKVKSMLGHITKIGSAFGVASMLINNFTKSLTTLRGNDTILTEISKTSEMTINQLRELGDEAFKVAGKFGQLSSNYLLAVQEMARSGYEETSKELGELSLLAQSAGDMTAENANNYLLATDAAYKYGGSVEKLNAALDGANFISNKNSASLTDIADATRVSASFAANAGVAIDELTAAEATMIATTKRSGSEIGRAFRSIVLNLQQVSGEFDGEVIDEEQLKKVEERCHSLGVELEYMKDGIATLRNPTEVLKDLAEVYNSLPDNSAEKQGLISDLGGKYHANALSALLSRWDLYEKMLSEFSQGAGSALEEAEKTANSWEGRLNSLQNSWDSFVNSLTNKDAIMGGVSFLDRLIQGAETFVDTFGTIPTVLTAINSSMVAMKKDYGLTQLVNPETKKLDIQGNVLGIDFSAIKKQKKHFEEAEQAILHWNDKLSIGKADLDSFSSSLVKNNAQFKAYLQTTSKDAPASLSGYKAYLNAAGVSTDALRLKTILLNSAISMGIGVAIQAAVQGITYLIQREENLRQATQEAANAYKESTSSIEDYTSRYEELHSALIAAKGNEEETYKIKQQLLELQTELNDKFGDEYGVINLVTDAYKDQTEVLKKYNKEAAKTYLNENQKGIENATREMTVRRNYNLGGASDLDSNDKWVSVKDVVLKYKDKGIDIVPDEYDGSLSIQLTADAESAYEIINEFETDIREKARELGDEHLFDDILTISSSELNRAKETIDSYGEIYKQALMANMVSDDGMSETYNKAINAVEKYNEAVLRSEDPFSDEKVKSARQDLKEIQDEISSDDNWRKYGAIVDDVFDQADTRLIDFNEELQTDSELQKLAGDLKDLDNIDLKSLNPGENASFDKLRESADKYEISVDELIDSLVRLGYVQGEIQSLEFDEEGLISHQTISDTIDQLNTQLKPAFDSLKSAYQDIFTDDGFTLENVDTSMLSSIKSTLDELNSMEDVDINIDYSSFENLAKVLTDTTSTADDVHDAFNSFATDIIDSLNPAISECDGESYKLMQTLLESMGIVNAEEIMAANLGYSYEEYVAAKEAAANASIDLANATAEDIVNFANETKAAEEDKIALLNYYQYKIMASGATIDTLGDVQALIEEYNQLGLNCNKLKEYLGLKGAEAGSGVDAKYRGYGNSTEGYDTSKADVKYPEVKFDGSKAAKSASKAGKKAGDAYVDAFKEEYDHLKDMLDRGEISETQYLNKLRSLYTKYFKDRKKYLDEYKKYEFEYLRGMLDLHNKALSGISTLLNRKISAANDAKDASISALQEEKEAAEEAYQAQIDAIEKEKDAIDDLIKEKNKKIASLNEEIDLIERAAESRKKNINLQQQEYNLQKMLNQRVKSVYKEGEGFVFEADTTGIKDAREKVKEAKEAIEIDRLKNEISLIQKEIDLLEEKKDSLSEEQDHIQKLMDESNKYYDNLIKQQEKMWDSIIKGMEQNKSRWEELAEVEEIAKAFSYIQQVFGDLGYTVEDVLNGSDAAFEDFKSRYISLISDVNSNSDFTEGLVRATGVAKENLGSFLDKTKETAEGIDELGAKGSEMDSVAEGMDRLSESATSASTSTGEIASSIGELNTNTEGLTDNLNGINDALTGIPEADKFDALTTSFTNLGDAIKGVASALGVGEEGTVGGLVGALQSLSELSLGEEETGIVSQFNNLKTAVEGVTSAISGGGSSGGKSGDASGSSSASMSAGAGGEGAGGSGSLVGAIEDFKSATDEALGGGGESGEGEGSGSGGTGAIPQFKELETAVNDVTTAIGSGESEGGESSGEGESDNLIGSIVNLGDTTQEEMGESDGNGIIGKFNEFKGVIEEAAEHVKSISDGLEAIDGQEVECTITVNVKMNGSIPAFASGTVLGNMQIESATYNAQYGKAFASGTIGLPKAEKNALVSEYGQTEMTVLPDGKTIVTDTPTMMDLPKDTVIYNEEQTKKIMDNKVDVSGNAHANGTDDNTIVLDDGTVLTPIQPNDKIYEYMKKWEAYMEKTGNNVDTITNSGLFRHDREMDETVKHVNNVNNVTNKNVQPVINQNVTINCPNVTNNSGVEYVQKELGHLSLQAYQTPLKDY